MKEKNTWIDRTGGSAGTIAKPSRAINPRFWFVRVGDMLTPAEFRNARRKEENSLSGFLKNTLRSLYG
ncbi:hypothetical protein AT270_10275 [Bacillus cereus]|nr:hypothetical protein AT270_10275 [Bacillus cereus]